MAHEDIIEIKPGIGPFSINLRALWRLLNAQIQQPDSLTVVAQRFLQLFNDHGVATSQIPRLIPRLTLEQVRSAEALLLALTPDIQQQAADLFQIERKWLDGTTDIIYPCRPSYKNPWAFFEDIQKIKVDSFAFPLVAFCSAKKLNYENKRDQNIVLVLREACAQLDDKTIYRYRIHDQFLWGYWKSRIQLKAMMRIWYQKFGAPVPVYKVDVSILAQIESGSIVPRPYYRNSIRLKGADLEDYSLSPSESRQAKEVEELPMVLKYVDAFRLEEVGKEGVHNSYPSDEALWFTQ